MIHPVSLIACLAGALVLLPAQVRAQTPEPLDPAMAKAHLGQQAKKPRFTPKAAVQSRTYSLTGKGAGVEIIEYATGEREERPYVAVPILFVVGTEELLDATSAANIGTTATILKELMAGDPKAKFAVQGHCSAEGDLRANQELSEKRARKIHELLARSPGVDAARISQVAFGSSYAAATASAPESERQKDRRVLVVRQ